MADPQERERGDIEEHLLNSVDAELHERLKNDHFEYDIDLNDEDSHANAAQLALLVKRNKKLLDQMEELEERFFDSEELKSVTQRKLNLIQKEVEDFRVLLNQRDAEHHKLDRELETLTSRIKQKYDERLSVENERRELEHKMAILKTEAEENERAQGKADKAADEAERLRRRIGEIIDQKATKASQLTDLDKKKADLEKKLEHSISRNQEYNAKTVADLEKVIDAERKRGQQAIDHVKRTLNAKLRFLELQLEEGRENVSNFTKEKRNLEKQLKSAIKELEDEESLSNHAARRVEALSRQLYQINQATNKALKQLQEQEIKNYELSRQKDTLAAQLDAALYINTKLSAEVPKNETPKHKEEKLALQEDI